MSDYSSSYGASSSNKNARVMEEMKNQFALANVQQLLQVDLNICRWTCHMVRLDPTIIIMVDWSCMLSLLFVYYSLYFMPIFFSGVDHLY